MTDHKFKKWFLVTKDTAWNLYWFIWSIVVIYISWDIHRIVQTLNK